MRRAVFIMALCCAAAAQAGDARSPLRAALDLARANAEAGRAARDPLALLVAARLRRDLGLAGAGADADAFDTPASLAAEARAMAPDDQRLASLADDLLAVADKGRERGPIVDLGRLAPGGREVYPAMRFAGGGRGEIYVEGKEPLALAVRDAAGARVCADDPGGPVAYCWWRQERDAALSVEIVNRSPRETRFRLITN